MSEEATFDQAAEDIRDVLGEDATFIPEVGDSVSLKVFEDQNVEYHPDDFIGVTRHYRRTIEYYLSDIGRLVEPGEAFVIGSERYIASKVIDNDGDGRFVTVEIS